MRSFANDAPEFLEFTFGDSDKVYKIPLASSMENKMIKDFNACGENYDKQVEWLRGIIGDVVDQMTSKTVLQVMQAWFDESSANGAGVGESSASSES